MLKGELLSKELLLSYQHSFSTADEVTSEQLRKQIENMRDQLASLEQPQPAEADAAQKTKAVSKSRRREDIFPAAMAVPKLRFELEHLFREQKIQETLFVLLTQRLEMAKVDEARDTSAFQILDRAVLPTYRSRPRGAKVVAAGLLLGLLAGVAWAASSLVRPKNGRSRVDVT
jgi:tyrosine-protein kinase Etk/Wzc